MATYRLLPEARYPDGADDVASFIEWIKDNISDYGG
ncbi:alpha/beta hydrolase, partial [Candidatus Bathyarchaeota archaeon]|nr:alpha/beta hydrolase [Candidatus Bathyarchaeota archaeon]